MAMGETVLDKEMLFAKTNGICIICGKAVDRHAWSVEHYIPRAIYKWVPDRYLVSQIESDDNLFMTHYRCNTQKDSKLPTLYDISTLHTNDAIKGQLYDLYDRVKYGIRQYKTLKSAILKNQKGECAMCKKKVSPQRSVLRRRYPDLPRTKDNAMCLCRQCNRQINDPKHLISSVLVIKKPQSPPLHATYDYKTE